MPSKPDVARRPKLRDIATAASVSVSAASFALNDQPGVSDVTRARVLEVAARLGYQRSTAAASLRTGKTRTFGLLMRNLSNPFFLDVVRGFEEACSAAGFSIVLGSSDYQVDRERSQIELFAARGVDGLVIAPIGGAGGPQLWRERTDRPMVLLNAASHAAPSDVARVHADNERAIRLVVQHLASLGHRKIAFLTAPTAVAADPERLATFGVVCSEMALTPVIIEAMPSLEASTNAIYEALSVSPGGRPTALMTNSDQLALAAYIAARQLGLRIPEDCSVVGHDDLPTSAFLAPPLTTVAVNRRALGNAVARFLIDRQTGSDSRTHIEPVSLVVRGSTAKPANQ